MKKIVNAMIASSFLFNMVAAVAGEAVNASTSPVKNRYQNLVGTYAGVQGGIGIPHDDSSNIGPALGLQVGHGFANGFRVEGAFMWLNNENNSRHNFFEVRETYNNYRFMMNAYYDFSTGTVVTPFLGAGIGWSYTHINAESGVIFLGSNNSLAVQGIAGLAFQLNEHWTLDTTYHLRRDDFFGGQSLVTVGLNYFFK